MPGQCVASLQHFQLTNTLSGFFSMQEMNKFHTILLDQASRTVLKNLTSFIKDDINQVKDYKSHFAKVSESLDNALVRNAQVSYLQTEVRCAENS